MPQSIALCLGLFYAMRLRNKHSIHPTPEKTITMGSDLHPAVPGPVFRRISRYVADVVPGYVALDVTPRIGLALQRFDLP